MKEIFISYRRIDTETSGGHLYEDLRRSFGADSVFMDRRRGGIAWGADWEKSLRDALQSCEVMIALIGPQWANCERSPGVRRLDVADDWVRGEIATALRLSKPVLPVLFQGAVLPSEGQMPDELCALGFHKRQAYPISENNWGDDTKRLFDELAAIPRLKQLHDLATSETGIRLLEQLIHDHPTVADAVIRSRAVIETTDREVDEIRLLKNIHDALHVIESTCLIPIRDVKTPMTRIRIGGYRRKFIEVVYHEIRTARRELAAVVGELPELLKSGLGVSLKGVQQAFKVASASPGLENQARVVSALSDLVGYHSVRLNDAIDNAAMRLQLKQLQDLMATVGALLRPAGSEDRELRPLLAGIDALDGLRVELALRVREHGWLQGLDNFLRQATCGRSGTGTSSNSESPALVVDWSTLKRLRGRFKEPFSPEMGSGHRALNKMERDIEAAVGRGDECDAQERIAEYANEVGDLFRRYDHRLKEFCFDLREKTRSLKTILDMCRLEKQYD